MSPEEANPTKSGVGPDVIEILDAVDIAIVVVDRKGLLTRFNQAAVDAFKLTAADIGRLPGSVAAFADLKSLAKQCAHVIADEAPFRRDIRSGDRQFLLRIAPHRSQEYEHVVGAVLTFTNVTAFRASIEQAVYEREYAKALLNTFTHPLVVLSPDLRVQSANRAFYSYFEYSRDETHNVSLRDLGDDVWSSLGVWTSLAAISAHDAGFEPIELERRSSTLGRRTLSLEARRVSREGNATILVTFQDITERKRAEEALLDADRRKDEFLALLAHELRNPLAPIRMGLELIRISGDTSESVGRVRPMMERQIKQLVRLVDDLLEVSRIASGKIVLQRANCSLQELIENAIEAQRGAIDSAHIEFTVDLPDVPCVVNVDAARFVQVVSNVLHNAAKFTPQHGKISCSAEIVSIPGGSQVAITVADSGIGIAKEMLTRVFDLFTQAEPGLQHAQGGLGIGLALARRLIEMHGGQIAAHSDGPGQGSAFVISLPLSNAAAGKSLPQVEPPNLSSRIVIIDDNEDAADILSMFVQQLGGSARVAYDAISGLELVQEFGPDVVFLDIGMPGMDGYEACRRIRQTKSQSHVVIVAVTGWGQAHDKERALDAGFDAHLTKPIDPVALARLLLTNSAQSAH
ncbi:MAG: ATP-binding protein [Gammaproteobacteria bacterium]